MMGHSIGAGGGYSRIAGTVRLKHPPRVKFGDHCTLHGVYVGLVVDVNRSGDTVTVASRLPNGSFMEALHKAFNLKRTTPRR